MKLGRLPRMARVALVPFVAGVLFLLVPASAQNNAEDPDIWMSIDIGEIREGRRATLTFSFGDGEPDTVDRHVYLAISGTATEGSEPDFTITGSNGSPLPSIGETLYNREIVIPAGATSAYARINVRNDNDAEQCEVIKVEGLWRDQDSDAKAFLGVFGLRIPANDLSRPHPELLPSVSVASLYPLVGVTLTATLHDPAGATREQWTWARSTRPDGPWEIVARYTDTYTPRAEDAGHYLRPEVRYDNLGYQAACAHTVSEDRVPGNPINGSNSPPDFGTESVDRAVSKDARMGSPVGAPVTASDPDNDPLTYSLESGDTDTFRIRPDTGQIMTNGHPLDTGEHTVTVKATDPMLLWDTVDVNIDVTDHNNNGGSNNGGSNNGGSNNGGSNNGGSNNGGGRSNGGSNNGGSNNGGSNNGGSNNGGSNNGGSNNGGSNNGGEPESTDTDSFSDLDSAGDHTRAVRILDGEGVFEGTGCSDGLLCPGGPLLRWEAAVWFIRVLDGMDPDPVPSVRFTDVDPKLWWAPYVERLAELDITVGCTEDPDKYCPDIEVTRAQMATLLKRAFGLPAAEPVGFVDTARTVHAPNIDSSYAAGITDSCSADPLKFCPLDSNSRAQVATYLLRGRSFEKG